MYKYDDFTHCNFTWFKLSWGKMSRAKLSWGKLSRFRSSFMVTMLRPEGGGVKVDFPVFTYLIRAAGDEQEEKNRTEI